MPSNFDRAQARHDNAEPPDGEPFCEVCDDEGTVACDCHSGELPCDRCDGDGEMMRSAQWHRAHGAEDPVCDACPDCNGSGKRDCTRCEDGRVQCEECPHCGGCGGLLRRGDHANCHLIP